MYSFCNSVDLTFVCAYLTIYSLVALNGVFPALVKRNKGDRYCVAVPQSQSEFLVRRFIQRQNSGFTKTGLGDYGNLRNKKRSSEFAQSLISLFSFRFLLSLAKVATEIIVIASTSL